MGWVVNTLIKILLNGICGLFKSIASDFITDFGINIGAKFPKVGETSTLAQVLASYNKDASSVFDTIFPMQSFKILFVTMALTIATALFVKELVLAIATPMIGQRQHPATSVAKYMGTIVGVVLSYRIFIIIEYVMNHFYIKFGDAAIKVMNQQAGVKNALDLIVGNSTADTVGSLGLEGALVMSNMVTPEIALGEGIGELILNVLIVWLLLTGFLKLILEILERYIVLGALFYTSPLAFSTLPSNDTRDIFKAWARMSISEMILIIMNSVCISIFLGALANLSTLKGTGLNGLNPLAEQTVQGSPFLINNRFSWMIYMLLLIAWLQFSQRLDSYLNSLGLSTAQTGGSLGAAVLAGMATAVGVGKAVRGGIRNTDTFKAMKAAKPGLSKLKAGGAAARDTVSKTAGRVADAAGGMVPKGLNEQQRKMVESGKQAEERASNAQHRYAAADYLRQNGNTDLGRKIRQGENLSGSEARAAANALAQASGDKRLQNAVSKSQGVTFGKDSNGLYGASITTDKGDKLNLALGGSTEGKLSAGRVGQASLGVSGSSAAMQSYVGERGMREQVNSEIAGHSNMIGGTLGDGSHGIRDASTGDVYRVSAPGSTDVGNRAVSIGNGFAMEQVHGATFQSYGKMDNLVAGQSKLFNKMMNTSEGQNLAKKMSSGPISNMNGGMLEEMLNVCGIHNPMLDNLIKEVSNNVDSNASWDGESKITITTADNGKHEIEFFNPDASERNMANEAGVDISYRLLDAGENGEALYEAIAASDLDGLRRDVSSIARDWSSIAGTNDGDGFTYAEPKEIIGGDINSPNQYACWDIMHNGDAIMEITRPELVQALGGSEAGWMYAGNYAYRMTPEGNEKYGKLVQRYQNYSDWGDAVDNNIYE